MIKKSDGEPNSEALQQNTLWSVEAGAVVPAAQIEMRRYAFPRPSELYEYDDAPIFSATLPRPGGIHGQVRFDGGPVVPSNVRPLLLRPGGIRMQAAGDGGGVNVITCRFDPHAFSRVTGLCDWDAARLLRCATMESRLLNHTMAQLLAETVNPGFAANLALEASVQLLMVQIARLFQSARKPKRVKGGLAPWQLSRIDEMLLTATGTWPTTSELAQQCGISRSHLSRTFAATTHRSLAEHAQAIRLERAKTLLSSRRGSIAEVAIALGFASTSAFSTAFRRATGQPPKRFDQAASSQALKNPRLQ